MSKKIEKELVKIKWLDSRGVNDRWERLSDSEEEKVCVCISVGYIIKESDKLVKIAPHIADEEDVEDFQYVGSMTIPKCSIVSRRLLDDLDNKESK